MANYEIIIPIKYDYGVNVYMMNENRVCLVTIIGITIQEFSINRYNYTSDPKNLKGFKITYAVKFLESAFAGQSINVIEETQLFATKEELVNSL